MIEILHWLSLVFLAAGTLFFVAGTTGMLRFPDVYSRLHAVTKADTLGLGLIILGLSLRIREWQPILLMILIWLLIMASSATACQLLARYQREQDQREDKDGSS